MGVVFLLLRLFFLLIEVSNLPSTLFPMVAKFSMIYYMWYKHYFRFDISPSVLGMV